MKSIILFFRQIFYPLKITLNRKKKLHSPYIKKNSCVILIVIGVSILQAQDEKTERFKNDTISTTDDYKMFNGGAHLKNMHIWHGFVVHQGAMFAANLEFNTRNKKFTFGLWGGGSFTSNDVFNENTDTYISAAYKEVSIYAVYRFSKKFFMEAVTHNNYTGVEERGDTLAYWSYDKTQGYNFVDVNFGYNILPNTSLYLATIIGGGSGDFEVKEDGSFENSWTHYLEAKSQVWEHKGYTLSLFAAGAWSFITDKTFYTEGQGNIINVGLSLNRDINIGSYKMPIEIVGMWNPEKEITVLSLDFTIF